MLNLFAYGSLMCSDIFTEVTGCSCLSAAATLDKYRRCCIKNELYPAIIFTEGWSVAGVLHQNLPDAAWLRLDRFEGAMYLRTPVLVFMENNVTVTAQTYVLRNEYSALLEKREWDYSLFIERKETFITQYGGFTKI